MHPAPRPWTLAEIRALGPTTDIPTLGKILGISRWKAYEMARTRSWEAVGIKVVRLGSKYRVIVASILDVLGQSSSGHTDERG
ncbi:MAG: DNA-binding protein [Streptosporangiales bacterium]|nr:DNA-binding protein [Streptosporangiales bacterium]